MLHAGASRRRCHFFPCPVVGRLTKTRAAFTAYKPTIHPQTVQGQALASAVQVQSVYRPKSSHV